MEAQRINIPRDEWPRCAICDMPVEDFYALDSVTDTIFVAACHNRKQETKLPDEVLEGHLWPNIEIGLAFDGEIKDGGLRETETERIC